MPRGYVTEEEVQRRVEVRMARQALLSRPRCPHLGVHGGMAANSFAILDFPAAPHAGEVMEPPLAYAESLTGALYLNKPDETAACNVVRKDLERRALDEPASRVMIHAVLDRELTT
ncbi:MAG TPA: Scr1 family TA system antitoxin-like transcriptional regulator [Actinoplanes sp.]